MSRRSAKAETRSDRIEVGRIGTAHGLRGEVTVEVSSDHPDRFARGAEFWLRRPEHNSTTWRVQSVRQHGKRLIIGFEGVTDRDAALALRGGILEIDKPEQPQPPEGQYYYYQLVGCRCSDRVEGDLGLVEDLLEDGGGIILRVVGEAGEVLIPFVEPYLRRVDVEEKIIELEVPEGLIEVCGSK
ncbi:MAG: ribosome maturation factor RimM [Thermoanaerobaculia bacterium]|nr:ribosome maturation factor RimM [Thermoanaerobaculia bacterium]